MTITNSANEPIVTCGVSSVSAGRAVLIAPSPPPPTEPPPSTPFVDANATLAATVAAVTQGVAAALAASVVVSVGASVGASVGGSVGGAAGGAAGGSGAGGGSSAVGGMLPLAFGAQRFSLSSGMAIEQSELSNGVSSSMSWTTGELGLLGSDDATAVQAADRDDDVKVRRLLRSPNDNAFRRRAPEELPRLLDQLTSFATALSTLLGVQLLGVCCWKHRCNRRYYAAIRSAASPNHPVAPADKLLAPLRFCSPQVSGSSNSACQISSELQESTVSDSHGEASKAYHHRPPSPPASPPASPPGEGVSSTAAATMATTAIHHETFADTLAAVQLQAVWRRRQAMNEAAARAAERQNNQTIAQAAARLQAALRRHQNIRVVAAWAAERRKAQAPVRLQAALRRRQSIRVVAAQAAERHSEQAITQATVRVQAPSSAHPHNGASSTASLTSMANVPAVPVPPHDEGSLVTGLVSMMRRRTLPHLVPRNLHRVCSWSTRGRKVAPIPVRAEPFMCGMWSAMC